MLMKSLWLPAGLVATAIVFAGLLLFGLRAPEETPRAVDSPQAPDKSASAASSEKASGGSWMDSTLLSSAASSEMSTTSVSAAPQSDVVVDAEEVALAPWQEAINSALQSNQENYQVAANLFALAPTLPLEGQVEAIQHMVNLTDDENYQNPSALLLNPATAREVADVIMADALNRPNRIKLPLLASVLSNPGHPLREDSRNTLQVILGEDYGDSPDAWSNAVQRFLAQEAQAEAQAAADMAAP